MQLVASKNRKGTTLTTYDGSAGIQEKSVCFIICLNFATFYCNTMQGRSHCFVITFFCKLELLNLVSDSCFKYLILVKQQLVPQENSTPRFKFILPPLSLKECNRSSLLNTVTGLNTVYNQTQLVLLRFTRIKSMWVEIRN